VFGDTLSNGKGEVRFCWEYSEIDARKICGCFGGGVDGWDLDEGYRGER